jgi:PHD/YefM family antitoxin component YafN of YafNO toxin-antitoxin module
MQTFMTSREFNQNITKAKRNSKKDAVIVTDRGKPAFVFLTYIEYKTLTSVKKSVIESLSMADDGIEFEPSRDKSPSRSIDF